MLRFTTRKKNNSKNKRPLDEISENEDKNQRSCRAIIKQNRSIAGMRYYAAADGCKQAGILIDEVIKPLENKHPRLYKECKYLSTSSKALSKISNSIQMTTKNGANIVEKTAWNVSNLILSRIENKISHYKGNIL